MRPVLRRAKVKVQKTVMRRCYRCAQVFTAAGFHVHDAACLRRAIEAEHRRVALAEDEWSKTA